MAILTDRGTAPQPIGIHDPLMLAALFPYQFGSARQGHIFSGTDSSLEVNYSKSVLPPRLTPNKGHEVKLPILVSLGVFL